MSDREAPLTARLVPAGVGSLRFAGYWMLGAVGIGAVGGVLMELVPPGHPLYTPLVLFQSLAIVAWLIFVVYRGTRGGWLALDGSELTLRAFLVPRRFLLTGDLRFARFATYNQGHAYFVGPVVELRTQSGREISVACIGPQLHRQLGLSLEERDLLAPTAVVSPRDFERLLRHLPGAAPRP